ncbi:hypothetical protein NA57DRAFT_62165 [Rhizodiscina lignyota]|uniref:Uncharacterized protein n=1 Tax=Rhizodiscina lignyota TaxID=1504668 RepID=A0A9P4I0S5_9PEZI|nr:hypothetical protein NA57DRAFT_62165 [Rhizodiscina lignyota]
MFRHINHIAKNVETGALYILAVQIIVSGSLVNVVTHLTPERALGEVVVLAHARVQVCRYYSTVECNEGGHAYHGENELDGYLVLLEFTSLENTTAIRCIMGSTTAPAMIERRRAEPAPKIYENDEVVMVRRLAAVMTDMQMALWNASVCSWLAARIRVWSRTRTCPSSEALIRAEFRSLITEAAFNLIDKPDQCG